VLINFINGYDFPVMELNQKILNDFFRQIGVFLKDMIQMFIRLIFHNFLISLSVI